MAEPKQRSESNWPRDQFGQHEVIAQFWQYWPLMVVLLVTLALGAFERVFGARPSEVIAYCAQDQVYAEAIFKDFQKETGIKVRAVFDNEAVKTVGLANRLRAERKHPQCNVFWGNEEMRTRQLAAESVF